MFSPSNRRAFLKNVTAMAAFSVSRVAFSAIGDSGIKASAVTDTLTLVTGAGGNIVVLNSPEGLLLVNGGLPERTGDLLKFLDDQFKGKRISTVFNTDWHLEHTGSND